VDGGPERECRAHGGSAPDRALNPERVKPQDYVFELPGICIVLEPLELGGQSVAAGVGEEGADPSEERLEVGQHEGGILDRAAVDPHYRRLGGRARLAPVEADAVFERDLRQG
jgi:hypothetical protein